MNRIGCVRSTKYHDLTHGPLQNACHRALLRRTKQRGNVQSPVRSGQRLDKLSDAKCPHVTIAPVRGIAVNLNRPVHGVNQPVVGDADFCVEFRLFATIVTAAGVRDFDQQENIGGARVSTKKSLGPGSNDIRLGFTIGLSKGKRTLDTHAHFVGRDVSHAPFR